MKTHSGMVVFESRGMKEEEILDVCSDTNVMNIHKGYHNWTSEIYGIGKHLREYGYYPASLPLFIHSDHGGPYQFDTILPIDLNTDSPVALFHSPRYVKEFKKHSTKECHVLYSPFVFYRRKHNIRPIENAQGTLSFVAHSTPLIEDKSEITQYISDLRQLPAQFQPVSVMIHYHDVNKGLYKVFFDNGIPVYTAGNPHDSRFTERFYSIIRNFKYTTANIPMSCLFYSIEMGIPHFLYGNKPLFINAGDENVTSGEYDAEKEYFQTRKIISLFTGVRTAISVEQKRFVEYELGLNNGISRLKCSFILYKAWIENGLLHLLRTGKKKLSRALWLGNKSMSYLQFYLNTVFLRQNNRERALAEKQIASLIDIYKVKTGQHKFSKLFGKTIGIIDSFWYLHSLEEIFIEEVYRFRSKEKRPRILDCGSNIGLSVIYFKRLFPEAEIVAFEPDQHICGLLKNNLKAFGFEDVVVENKAVWRTETVLKFSASGNLGGRLDGEGNADSSSENSTLIPTVRLRNYLNDKIDFLKLDIEGPEIDVLEDCADLLINVKHLFVEYHSDPGKEQRIEYLLSILKKAGFRVYIKEAWNNLPFPFLRNDYNPYYDLQLNIFAYRVQ